MEYQLEPLRPEWLPQLSQFLRAGFRVPDTAAFADVEVLRWKYFDLYGPARYPRSLVVRDNDQIIAHMGVCPSSFVRAASSVSPVTSLSGMDWLTTVRNPPVGAMLLLETLQFTDVSTTLGCTPEAARVIRGAGSRIVTRVPLYQKVLRVRPRVFLHRRRPLWKRLALLAMNLSNSIGGLWRHTPQPAELRRVDVFDDRVSALLNSWRTRFWHSERSPDLLNHYLRFPKKSISGWWIVHENEVCGFALLSHVEQDNLRVGKIVDCIVDPVRTGLWTAAISALSGELRRQGCDLAMCYGSTSWMATALSANGYFRRSKTPFYLRDPRHRISLDCPIHLTHLEADGAYLP
jgi:hypothetical protein